MLGIVLSHASKEKALQEILRLSKQGYCVLGEITFTGGPLRQTQIQSAVARLGGDFYIYVTRLAGVRTGSRMVPVAYTTPTSVSTTSDAVGLGTYSGNYGGIYGPAAVNGTALAFGSSTSQTQIGGTTTYGREQFQYTVFDHDILVMSSPGLTLQLLKMDSIRKP